MINPHQEDRSKRTPAVLLPYQQRWVEDKSAVKICEKSRRIGISWADASDAALTAARTKGDSCYYIGYSKDMARQYIEDTAGWAQHYQLAAYEIGTEVIEEDGKLITVYRVPFRSGHVVEALSSRPRSLRSKQGHIRIDEAAFHDDLPGLLKAANAMLMWGGSVSIISTHNGDDHPFNELVKDTRAGKYDYSLHRITIDDALAAGLYERICLRLGTPYTPEAEAAWLDWLIKQYRPNHDEELYCIPAGTQGAALSRLMIENCMKPGLPVLRLTCPAGFVNLPELTRRAEIDDWIHEHLGPLLSALDPKLRHFLGEDFGRTGDLTVMAPLEESQTLHLATPFMLELRNVPFENQRQIAFHLLSKLPRFSGAAFDARGNGQYLAEVCAQKFGAHLVAQVMLSNTWYLENMPRFRAAFEDRTITVPRDADVLDDLRALRIEKGVIKLPETGGRTKGRDGEQRHGDAAIALALAHHAAKTSAYVKPEYTRAAARRARFDKGAW